MGGINRFGSGGIRRFQLISVPPIITSGAAFTMDTGNTAAGTVVATDGETPYVFSIVGGADAALLSIDPDTGAITFDTTQHYHTPNDSNGDNIYEITVRVTSSGGAYVEQNVTVEVTFDPLSLTPLLWLDPTRGLYSDAGTTPVVADDPVYQWNDYSGSARNVSQATLIARPLYKTNIQNSLPGILFDNANDVMASTLTRASVTGSSVWYASLITPIASGAEQEYFGFVDVGGGYHQWYVAKDSANKVYSNGYDGSGHSAAFTNAATMTGVCVVNTFDNGGNNEIYRDGTLQQQTASGSPTIGSSVAFKVGANFYAANFYMHELFVFDGSPTTDKRKNITRYLMVRGGLI